VVKFKGKKLPITTLHHYTVDFKFDHYKTVPGKKKNMLGLGERIGYYY